MWAPRGLSVLNVFGQRKFRSFRNRAWITEEMSRLLSQDKSKSFKQHFQNPKVKVTQPVVPLGKIQCLGDESRGISSPSLWSARCKMGRSPSATGFCTVISFSGDGPLPRLCFFHSFFFCRWPLKAIERGERFSL